MKRYASIRFDRAIGPLGSAGVFRDAISADDGYNIAREDDYVIIGSDSGPLEVPWSRVISATPLVLSEPGPLVLREHNADVEDMQIDEEKVATLAPRKGGWPKGKPRKPAAEGGEA